MEPLRSRSASDSASGAGGTVDGRAGVSTAGQGPHGGPGNIEADLQSLIQQLSSPSSSSGSGTATAASTGSSALSDLEQSFQNLLNTLGVSGGDASLNRFLQALQSNLQGVSPPGNLVNTTA
jgi:hypothetical protein